MHVKFLQVISLLVGAQLILCAADLFDNNANFSGRFCCKRLKVVYSSQW